MSALVVDASAFAPFIIPDEAQNVVPGLEDTMTESGAIVPQHWPLEIANMVLVAARRKRIIAETVRDAITSARSANVRIDNRTASEAFDASLALAQRHELSSYDAAYLELAKRLGLPLATRDKALARAAIAEAVPVFAA